MMGVEPIILGGAGLYLSPGIVDPHQHLTGGSGEDGFATQTPQITLRELIYEPTSTPATLLRESATCSIMCAKYVPRCNL